MIQHLGLALVHEPTDYKRALILAQMAHDEGRMDDAESLVSIVYDLIDAMTWPGLGAENAASDTCQNPGSFRPVL